MERLTTNKDISDIEGMCELAHNSCYIDKDGNARYRDFYDDVDARDFVREISKKISLFETGCAELIDDESFDATMIDWLQYSHTNAYGLIALIYRNLWAMADLREKLKSYEDAEEQGLLLRLPCKVGDTVYFVDFDENEYDEAIVESIEFGRNGFLINSDCEIGTYLGAEYLFLTKEEAEQALKQMGE